MIKHIVLLDLPPDHDRAALADIMAGIDALRVTMSGFTQFDHGPNRDFENKSPQCTYAFVCHFADEDTAQRYLVDPDHAALGKRLVGLCRGGANGISVIDLDLSA